jgi:DNA-binding MarR family transcriptional regulator
MQYMKAAKFFNELAEKSDSFRVSQLGFLLDIAATGDSGLNMTDYSKRAKVTTATLSRRCKLLMSAFGNPIIRLESDPTNLRYKRAVLTDAGKALLHDMEEAINPQQKQ